MCEERYHATVCVAVESVLKSTSSYGSIAETSYIARSANMSVSENQVKITITFERYKIA